MAKGTTAPTVSVDFDGTWYNQHGSKMELNVTAPGIVSGRYSTKVGAPGDDDWFQLTGLASGDQIAFCVNFEGYGSLTAWVGQQIQDASQNAQLVTLWHLTKNVQDPDEPAQLWATVLTGSDIFMRNAPVRGDKRAARQMPSHPLASRRNPPSK